MRTALSILYKAAEILGAVLLAAIALLVVTQVASRLLDRMVPGADELAGYCMAASFFLMLGPSLRRGAHIRVGVLVERLHGGARRAMELLCLGFATALSAYFAWYWARMTYDSYDFGDLSQGVLPIPLWMPQALMAAGLAVLVIALLDDLLAVLRGGEASYQQAGLQSEG
ncbi:TRAP transporter small permease [Azospirillum picis]|uniref:TRAP transporter small permease protein n=1 Tax=Azospirillum picis TaxID=488438 RepID=A0ABU0MQ33_9PROT|nr:TRAP transporter small permease [Azospirillum picis]MBP2302122.1 TRAP-type C4-dicarboxylate transport system permease small subunit [Azospirillum picis]MDQ0535587.1 TRAP-type C4-dicarboxylate transport system permease small subunit [Azospirillum picis]